MTAVTVGMPVYNAAAYLDAALTSLTEQSFQDFTLLISDNASTDDTSDILAAWAEKDPRIKIVRQQENIGAAKNFEYVLEHAESEWFMFASHDDKWSPNYIEVLYNAALQNPETDLVVPRVTLFYEDGRESKTYPLPLHHFEKTGVGRIRGLLMSAHGSWFYGLHRRDKLIAVQKSVKRYGYVWGFDLVTMLPCFLSGRTAAGDEAVFSHLETDISRQRYRPSSLKDQWGIYRAFWREVCTALNDAPLTRWQKLALLPALVRYVDRHSCKFRRIVKSAVLYPFRKG